MDGYDLFSDDLTNGVLDGLAELGAMESQYASHTGPSARPPQAGSDALQSGYIGVGQPPSYAQIGSGKPGAGAYPGYSQYGSYPNQQDVGVYQQGMLPSLMGGFQQHNAGLATGHNPNPAYTDYAQKSNTANVRMPNLPNTLQQYAPQQFNAYTSQSHGANYPGQAQHWTSMSDHGMSHQHYSTEGAFRAQPGYVNTLPRQAPIPSIGLQQPAQSAPVTIPYYTHTATSAPPTQLYPQNTYLTSHSFLGYPNQTGQGGVESVPSSQNYPVVSQSYGVSSSHNQYMPQYSNYYSDQSQMTHHVTPSQPIPNTSHLYSLSFGNSPTPSAARPSYVHAPQATASPTPVRGPAPGPPSSIPGSPLPHQPMAPQQQPPVRSSLQHLEHLVMPQAQKMMPSPKAQAGNGIMSPVSRPRTPMSPKNSTSSSQWPGAQTSAPKPQFTPYDQHKGMGNKPSPLCETEQQQTSAAPQNNSNMGMGSNQNQMRENFLQDNSCYPGMGQGTEKNGHVASFPSSPAGVSIKPQSHSVGFNPEATYSPNAMKAASVPCPPEVALAPTSTQNRMPETSSSMAAPITNASAQAGPPCAPAPDGSRLGLEQQGQAGANANSGFLYQNAAPCPPNTGYNMPCIPPPSMSDVSRNNSPSGYKPAETLAPQQQQQQQTPDARTVMQMQPQPNIFQGGVAVAQNEQFQHQAQGAGVMPMNGSQAQPAGYPPSGPNTSMQLQHPPNVSVGVAPPPVPDMVAMNSGQNFYNDKMQNLNSGPPPHSQLISGPGSQAPYPGIQHEIMTLQQQLQHLYGQPQTGQSQAQIRDIHERLRFLQGPPPQGPPPGLAVMGVGPMPMPMGQMPLPIPNEVMSGAPDAMGSGWETPKGKTPKSPRKPKEAKPKKGKKGAAVEAENSSSEIPPMVNLGPEVYEFKDAPIEPTEKSKKPRKPRETKPKGEKTKGTAKLGRPKLSRKKTEGPEDAAGLQPGAEAGVPLGESSFEDGTQSSMNVSTAESTMDTTVDSTAAGTGTDDQSSQPEKAKKKAKPKTKTGVSRKRPNKILIASLALSRRHKRKRSDSEGSDLAVTPPPSPPPEGDNSNKRRSGRHSHSNRKKYVDDLDLILSDEDLLLPAKTSTPKAVPAADSADGAAQSDPTAPPTDAPAGQAPDVPCIPEVKDVKPDAVPNVSNKPNFVYVNPADEDTMIVQHILAVRMGKREILSSSDDEDEEEIPDTCAKTANAPVPVPEPKDEKQEPQAEAVAAIPPPDEKSEQESKPEQEQEPAKEEKETELKSSASNGIDEPIPPADADQADSGVKADEAPKEGEQKEENVPVVPAPDSADETSAKPASVTEEKPAEAANVAEEAPKPQPPSKSAKPNRVPEFIDVEEYYVKYKNFSYLHCEWKTEEELLKGDKRVVPKIRRFKQRMNQRDIFEFLEEDPFNPEYTESDRILDMSEVTDPATGKVTKNYLVKWRSLPYDECTWELEDDIDPDKLKQFHRFYAPPPKDQWRVKKRPKPNEWTKLNESPLYKNGNTLRPYQLEGLNWLNFSWFNGRNCILADEMGLGKTIQSLAFADAVYKYGIRGPFLIIAPLSTVPNWQREFETWTDLNVVVYHGSVASRNMIQEYELFYRHPDNPSMNIKDVYKFNVLITTFEIVLTDVFELKDIPFRACIIDEAHRLKNKNCKLLEGLRLLNLEHRVLLSGTPLQNNINELFSLLNFLEPSQFTSADEFYKEFGELTTETQVQKLQALLKPMMLRRLKEDVEKSIAPKEETIIEVELTNMQKKYYRAILERNFSFLSKGTTAANIPNLMNTMMELRKVCIHPYLLNGAEEQIQLDYRIVHNEPESDPDLYHKALITSAGKMVLVDKLLPKLKANGHRVLIFSQMVRCLDILEDYMIYRKYPYERLDGRIRGPLRQAAIDRFSKPDSDRFVFLLCTKAGGLGINLTAADTVIIYDSDWNPQNDLQAQARCHRIGQAKMVKVYRLICRNTYEREMFDRASLKLGLDKAVLQSMNTGQKGGDPNSKQLSKKEVEDLLKRGAYGAIMDEDNAGDKFCEEDIDCILQRRTQVITLEQGEKGSTFSKASFASTGIREDININDPDFWTKWAKKAEIDLDESGLKNELVMHEPRRRTRIKRYGQDEAVLDISEFDSSSDSDEEGNIGERTRGRGKRNQLKPRRSRRAVDEDFHCDDGVVEYGRWSRNECYKIEKGLLCFGWSRWTEILNRGQFRDGWGESYIEDCARIILIHCVKHFRGDEKVKQFVTDLISPVPNENPKPRNYSGLENPVSRGNRRNKNKAKDTIVKTEVPSPAPVEEWINNERYDPDVHLDDNYKKHIEKHANKMLLRVRMLYYIKQEIIGENAAKIAASVPISELGVCPPSLVIDAGPIKWWDLEADASLLVGTYKHGYEKYEDMRSDPYLCFLARCGPVEAEVVCKQEPEEPSEVVDSEVEKSELPEPEGEENENPPKSSEPDADNAEPKKEADAAEPEQESPEKLWPSASDLNTRLRKLITSFQRNFKKEEIKNAQKVKKLERKEKIEQLIRDRERQKLEVYQKRWSKREEADFFRAVSTYGVQYNRKDAKYDWGKFRLLSKLDKKFDETLTEYFRAFYAMCKRVSGKRLTEQEEFDLIQVPVEPLPEERAKGTIDRIDLLSKIREEIIFNSQLEERLKLCLPSLDLPEWWVPGKHDRDLLLGAAKHGLGRTDVFILGDNELSFKDILIQAACPMLANVKPKQAIREEPKPTKSDVETKNSDTVDIVVEDMKEKEKEKEKEVDSSNSKAKEEEQKSPSNSKPSEEDGSAKDKDKDDPDRTQSPKPDGDEQKGTKPDKEVKEEASAENATTTTQGNNADTQNTKSSSPPQAEPPPKESEAAGQDKEASQDAKSELNEVQVEVKDEFKITIKLSAEKMKKVEVQVKGTPTFPFPDSSAFNTRVEKEVTGDMTEFSTTMEAVNPAALVRWPRDNAIQLRVEHIVYAVENNQWPVSRFFSSAGVADYNELNTNACEQAESHEPSQSRGGAPTPSTVQQTERIDPYAADELTMPPSNNAAPSSRRGRRRRIAIDVEADRAKLQALLQQTNVPPPHFNKGNANSNVGANKRDVRRKVGMAHARGFEPPPAHAHQKMQTFDAPPDHRPPEQTRRRELSRFGNIPQISTLDLSIKPTRGDSRDLRDRNKQLDSQTMSALSSLSSVTVTPLNSDSNYDSSVPMDLSSRISERIASTSSRSNQALRQSLGHTRGDVDGGGHQPPKSKLESMLSKLKRGRAEDLDVQDSAQEMPREKKRKKLDEIVFGLSAAKTQQKGPSGRAENGGRSNEAQQRPQARQSLQSAQSQLLGSTLSLLNSPAGKEFSRNLKNRFATPQSRTESDNLARIDLAKSDFARLQSFAELGVPKFDLFSQDAKVNKWLAEHANLPPDPSTSPETDKKRRKPRQDPTLMDWSKLTGDENISVIHRVSGKKLTGPKAPQLRHLAEWLAENNSYDVDPRWADLVRERGNLPSDLQKRLFTERRKEETEKRGAGTSPASDAGLGSSSQASSSKFTAQNLLQNLSPGAFDPKNPLFMPFGGLGSLGNLASFGNMAQLGMGNPLLGLGMPGMSPADFGLKKTKETSSGGGSGTKKRGGGDKNAQNASASASSMLSGALPFLLSNPGLMYPPLGLGSFPLGANLESHFGSLSGQAALFNAMTNLTEGHAKSSSKSANLSAQDQKKSSTSRKESNHQQQAPTPSTSQSQKSVPLSFPQSSAYFEHHHEDSDDESMKSLLDNHTDDLPDDDSPNEHAERVIIKESKDLEKELAEQKQNKRRERRALEDSHHGGLSSMERQLLMSKKRERLAKEESIPSRRTGRTTRSAAAASKTLEDALSRLKNDGN